jgi:LuxR family maltose regulon positive regulatory protein
MTLCFIAWVAADLPSLQLAANRCLDLGEVCGLPESISVANYFSGIADYHQNDLSAAAASLVHVVSNQNAPNQEYYTEGAFALASVYQARGRANNANETIKSVCEHLLGAGNMAQLLRAQAYQADLAVRQGRITEALEWAQGFDPEPFEANTRFFEPRLTLAKVLIVEGEKTSLESAAVLLQRLAVFYAGIHNSRFLIEVLALQALVCDAQGDEPTASERLTRAVHLAQPGGFIRLFVDLGPALARLLHGLDLETRESRYVARILSAFSGEGKAQTVEALDHTLTKREVEILGLLAGELSNRQISDQLCISAATVKRHTENIYQKLGVHGRRKAVTKALAFSIIDTG